MPITIYPNGSYIPGYQWTVLCDAGCTLFAGDADTEDEAISQACDAAGNTNERITVYARPSVLDHGWPGSERPFVDAIAGLPKCDCDGYSLHWGEHDGRCELKKAIIRLVFATIPCVNAAEDCPGRI